MTTSDLSVGMPVCIRRRRLGPMLVTAIADGRAQFAHLGNPRWWPDRVAPADVRPLRPDEIRRHAETLRRLYAATAATTKRLGLVVRR